MYTDPGDPKKEIFIADVRTKIRGCKEWVRTILLLNDKEKGKDRIGSILYIRTMKSLRHMSSWSSINQSNLEISWFKDKVLRFEFETEEELKKRKSFLFAG